MIHLVHCYQKIDEIKHYSSDIVTDTTIDQALEKLSKHDILALDTETTSLDVLRAKLLMLQIGIENGDQFVFDMRTVSIEALRSLLESKTITFVGHNIKYDYNVLKTHKILLNKVYDTMVVDKVLYNGDYTIKEIIKNRRFSLAGVYKHYFDVDIDKETRQQFHTVHDQQFTEQQIRYGALDVVFPLEIKEKQQGLINRLEVQRTVDLENSVLLALGDIEYNGFHLNSKKWLDIAESYKPKIIETTAQLDNLLLKQDLSKIGKYVKNSYQIDLFDSSFENRRKTIVNWGSDKQVYDILSKVFNIYPTDKYGKPSSGAQAIELLPEEHEITKLILKLRKEEKAVSTFGKKFLDKFLNEDSRIRTSFNQIVETGRISSRNPNLQQIPAEMSFRSAFEAPEGCKIVTSDYSSQEARIMADKAKDESYIKFFNSGAEDIHSFVATKMFSAAFGKEFIVTKTNKNKAYRQKGKTINFAISFGGSAFALSKSLKIPQEEAQELIDSFFKGFPKLRQMFETNKQFALQYGFIRTNPVVNRIRKFRYWNEYIELLSRPSLSREEISKLMRVKGKIERRALNTPIQGTASDMTKTALVLIRRNLISLGYIPYDREAQVKLVSVVHDECSIECKEELSEQVADLMKKNMEEAGSYYVKSMVMKADPVIKNYWDH